MQPFAVAGQSSSALTFVPTSVICKVANDKMDERDKQAAAAAAAGLDTRPKGESLSHSCPCF